MKKWLSIGITVMMGLSLLLTACGQGDMLSVENMTTQDNDEGTETSDTTPNLETSDSEEQKAQNSGNPIVYMTTEISPESLMEIYAALEAEPTGNIAVKLSTGEPGSNYLRT